MRVTKKTVAALVAATALLAAAAGCGGADPKKETDKAGAGTWATHDDLVAAANKEGAVKLLTSMVPEVDEALTKGFEKLYPDIDAQVDELQNDESQKFLLELQAGNVDYDSFHYSGDNDLKEFAPYLADIDLMKLAEDGVIDVPTDVINPASPNMMSAGTGLGVVAYNKKMLSEDEVPSTYEEFLDPKWKGKFLVQIDGDHFVELFQAWGKDKVLDYAKKIAAQDPVWTDSNTAGLTTMAAGEHPLFLNTHYQSAYRLQQEQPDTIGIKFLSPVPGSFSHIEALRAGAEHPAAAVLFYEYLMGPEAQKALFELEPVTSSVYTEGSQMAQEIEGDDLSIINWDNFAMVADWQKELAGAFGFPTSAITE